MPVLGWGHQGGWWGALGVLGVTYEKMKMVFCKVLLKTQDGLLNTIEHELRWMGPKLVPLLATRCLYQRGNIWAQVNWTLYWGTSELRSTRPNWVSLLVLRCLYEGGPINLNAKRTSENMNTLGVLGLASQRSFLQKTNKVLVSRCRFLILFDIIIQGELCSVFSKTE